MALSNSERQRKYRERKKHEEKVATDIVSEAIEIAPLSFSDFLKGDEERVPGVFYNSKENELSFISETFYSVGQNFPDLEIDEDPEWEEHNWPIENRGSLGRAERMVGGWVDAARQLAELINEYKVKRVEKALEILLESDLSDPDHRKEVLARIVRLEKAKETLKKEKKFALRSTSVKGDI